MPQQVMYKVWRDAIYRKYDFLVVYIYFFVFISLVFIKTIEAEESTKGFSSFASILIGEVN